jgi:hypothetical protein
MKLLPVGAVAAIALAVMALPTRTEAQLHCFDSYVLLTGRCPDACSHGNDCPCITCTN